MFIVTVHPLPALASHNPPFLDVESVLDWTFEDTGIGAWMSVAGGTLKKSAHLPEGRPSRPTVAELETVSLSDRRTFYEMNAARHFSIRIIGDLHENVRLCLSTRVRWIEGCGGSRRTLSIEESSWSYMDN